MATITAHTGRDRSWPESNGYKFVRVRYEGVAAGYYAVAPSGMVGCTWMPDTSTEKAEAVYDSAKTAIHFRVASGTVDGYVVMWGKLGKDIAPTGVTAFAPATQSTRDKAWPQSKGWLRQRIAVTAVSDSDTLVSGTDDIPSYIRAVVYEPSAATQVTTVSLSRSAAGVSTLTFHVNSGPASGNLIIWHTGNT